MERRQIVIDLDCEDEQCGMCVGPDLMTGDGAECDWIRYGNFGTDRRTRTRGPECLAAEKLLRDLLVAGKRMRVEIATRELDDLWDAAVNAVLQPNISVERP